MDVTKHNSNLPPLAVKNPDCLGLLHKMDKSKDSWVQHYCILKDGCLYLYSGIRATHAQGTALHHVLNTDMEHSSGSSRIIGRENISEKNNDRTGVLLIFFLAFGRWHCDVCLW